MYPTAGPSTWTGPTEEEQRALQIVLSKAMRAYGNTLNREELKGDMLIALWRSADVRATSPRTEFSGAWQVCENATMDALRSMFGRGEKRTWSNMLLDPIGSRFCVDQPPDMAGPEYLAQKNQSLSQFDTLCSPSQKLAVLALFLEDDQASAAASIGRTRQAHSHAIAKVTGLALAALH